MAWNKNLPADATKIRNAPTAIQENWDAIESGSSSLEIGSVNYYDRDAAGSTYSSDPAIVSTSSVLYAKEDDDSVSRLFALDPNGDTSQLTPFISTIAANGKLILPNGLVFLWGSTTGDTGAKSFHTPFATACLNLQVSVRDSAAIYGSSSNVTASGFTWKTSSASSAINYFAIGN